MKKINCLFLVALLVLSAGCKKGEEPIPEDYYKITTLLPDSITTTGASLYAKYESGSKYQDAERGIYVSGLIDGIETVTKIVCEISPEFAAVLSKLSPNSAYSYNAGMGARCISFSVPDGQYEGHIYLSNAPPSLGLRVRAVCDRNDALRPQE